MLNRNMDVANNTEENVYKKAPGERAMDGNGTQAHANRGSKMV